MLKQYWGQDMSSATEILNARLAKGEISLDEYRALLSAMGGAVEAKVDEKQRGEPIDVAPPKPVEKKKKNGWIGWAVAGGVIAVILMGINNVSSGKVEVLNLRSSGFFGDQISGRLYTEGDSGTVYVWIEMNNKRMCPRKTYIVSKQPTPFEFTCRDMPGTGGTFSLNTNRFPDDWVEKNALSL